MKLSFATMAAVAVANDKKVPPRHPLNRLNKLRFFFNEFAADVVNDRLGENVADRFATRFGSNMLDNFESAFNRDNCGYYDSGSKHGGPDPAPETRPNGKPRNRRDDEDDSIEADPATIEEWCIEKNGNYSNDEQHAWCCKLYRDEYTKTDYCGPMAPRSSAGKNNSYDRLASEPSLRWRQITTGARKWVERYINNCGGQRKNNLGVKRIRKVYKKWDEKLNL